MSIMRLPLLLLAMSVVLGAVLESPCFAGEESARKANNANKLNAEQRIEQSRDIQQALSHFRSPHATDEQRVEAANKLFTYGDDGARQLLVYATRELKSLRLAYLKHFEKTASKALRAKWPKNADKEILQLQQTVNAVTKMQNLSKEAIKANADPAMDRLTELLTIERQDVLAFDATLATERQRVFATQNLAQRAQDALSNSTETKFAAIPSVAELEDDLQQNEDLAARMATPMTDPDRSVMMQNLKLAKQIEPEEAKGVEILNFMRMRVGLNPGRIDVKLCAAARGHSADMMELKFFAHDSPVKGKKSPWDRAKLAGTTAGGENIYMGSARPESAIMAWWYSPGHHKNMMGSHQRVGLGKAGGYWTQMFGG